MKILLTFLYIFTICEYGDGKIKKPLPFFRRTVEEVGDYDNTDDKNTRRTEDPRSNLVSILVKNVREIFQDTEDQNIENDVENDMYGAYTLKYRPTMNYRYFSVINQTSTTIRTDDVMNYENLSLTPLPFLYQNKPVFMSIKDNTLTDVKSLQHRSKELLFLGKSMDNGEGAGVIYESTTVNSSNVETVDIFNLLTSESAMSEIVTEPNQLSCIQCNNVDDERCANPKNRLIPSILCESEGDECFSQHTPFGIVNRGCYNVYNNMSTYVCSCNLCNSIPLSEMPYVFSKKQDWIENVIEMSRTRHLRRSVFRDMSCLNCTVNDSQNLTLNDSYCLDGNIASISRQQCDKNEICGIKAIKNQGYIWRGCLKKPLYNYWMYICNNDLCNYDKLVSLYDKN